MQYFKNFIKKIRESNNNIIMLSYKTKYLVVFNNFNLIKIQK